MADVPLFYWDACILLEFLRGETPSPTKTRAIQRLLDENARHENKIMTSVITHVEVLPKKITEQDAEKEKEYWSYYDGKYFIDVELSRNILLLAREIKDYYYKPSDPSTGEAHKMMSTGDAIHLATAIIYEVDELHTRDKRSKGGNVPILGLAESSPGGKIAGTWSLNVVSPEDPQADLLDPTENTRQADLVPTDGETEAQNHDAE